METAHTHYSELPLFPLILSALKVVDEVASPKLNMMESLLGHRIQAREHITCFIQIFPKNKKKIQQELGKFQGEGNMVRGEILRHPELAELSVSTTNNTTSRTNKSLLVPSKDTNLF